MCIGRVGWVRLDERHQDAPLCGGQVLLRDEASPLPLGGNTRQQREQTPLVIACERVARWEEWFKSRKHAIHRQLLNHPLHMQQGVQMGRTAPHGGLPAPLSRTPENGSAARL